MKKNLQRPVQSHKGDYGHAWILAGSRGMAGAGYLAAAASVRSGAGKTSWVTTREAYRVMGKQLPEAMSLTFPEAATGGFSASAVPAILKRVLAEAQAIAAGPGMGRSAVTRRLVLELLAKSRVPLILDADALWALQGRLDRLKRAKAPVVLTPHVGELKKFFGASATTEAERRSVAKRIANQYHCVLVWKGPDTLVVSPEQKVYVNTTGNPGLAKGGSGDVLTGIIAGLAAQGFSAWDAARIGVYAHGRAADAAVAASSMTSLAASDLLKFLPPVWADLEKKRDLTALLE